MNFFIFDNERIAPIMPAAPALHIAVTRKRLSGEGPGDRGWGEVIWRGPGDGG